jgi:tRNA A-37 threonylcarbamoyl transferase component Bud32
VDGFGAISEQAARIAAPARWQIIAGWHDALLGPQGLRLEEWLDAGRAKIVKHGPARTVYRVDLPEQSIFLKHYRCLDLWGIGRHLLRGSSSRREFRKAVELARRQVPTIRPVAVGEIRRSGVVGDNFLVTEAVPHAVSLHEYATRLLPQLPLAQRRRMRNKLTRALARLCAAAHEAGVFHNDFHGGNILVRVDTCSAAPGDGRLPDLYLVDLPGIRFSGPLGWSRSRASLTMLASDWGDKSTPRERWRFWREYLAARPRKLVACRRKAAAEVVRQTREYACRLMRGRGKRALRTNRDFYGVTTAHGRGHAVTQFAPADLVRLIEQPERLLGEPSERVAGRHGADATVRASLMVDGSRTVVRFERWPDGPWWRAMLRPLGRSRALAVWYWSNALRDRGIPTPRPLAACSSISVTGTGAGYLVSQWVDGALPLGEFLERVRRDDGSLPPAVARDLAEAVGRLCGRLHAWRIVLDDFQLDDLLVVCRDGRYEAWVLDVLKARITRRLSSAERRRQAGRMLTEFRRAVTVSRSHGWRCVQAYGRELGAGGQQQRRWWRELARESEADSAEAR